MFKRWRYFIGLPVLGVGLLFLGYSLGWNAAGLKVGFHDITVREARDFTILVDHRSKAVRSLAATFGATEDAYLYVRDKIILDTTLPASSPDETIRTGTASCLGKAILLCSLYRAMGIAAEEVRVVMGELVVDGKTFDHAWLDFEIGSKCYQQDPSGLFAWFKHDSFPGTSFTERFARKESFCFNDKGFAVMSQTNRFRTMEDLPEYDNWSRP